MTHPLPLRLAAEPFIRTVIGSNCFILPSIDEDALCYVISNHGLIAFATNQALTRDAVINLTQLLPDVWPHYSIVRTNSRFSWYLDGNRLETDPSRETIIRSVDAEALSRPIARAILESITRYYSRQVLEPSIRGFLGILEKQFPRNDLYLFELLQNSVDDGASMVVLKSFDLNTNSPGLFFCHNGRCFSPLDILGLASVGLSTKGTEDKKKIGFMGVGFKAVYKRFGSVMIYDHIWSLQFEEPNSPPLMEPSHSWVLKPNLIEHTPNTSLERLIPRTENLTTETWCHFVLQKPRGGVNAIRSDLTHLSFNVPVLLGRQFVWGRERAEREWTLIWEETKFHVTCREKSSLLPPGKTLETLCESKSGKFVGGIFDEVEMAITSSTRRDKSRSKVFQFLTVSYHPTRRAQEAFESHTKKKWSTQATVTLEGQSQILTEDISLFFEVGENGLPVIGTSLGKIHAILPTKLLMPCSMNLQASWLLSVDRQDVQNVAENDWNHCLVNQLPRLLILLLRWIAKQVDQINSSANVSLAFKSFYQLFPKFLSSDQADGLHLQVMHLPIMMTELVHSLKIERIIPIRSFADSMTEIIRFGDHSEVIWLPAPMMKYLSAKVVHMWFNRWPFASKEIGDELCLDSLWTTSLTKPTIELLNRRRPFFASAGEEFLKSSPLFKLQESLKILAALASVQESSVKEIYHEHIAALEYWPIFPTENGRSVVASEIVWLNFDEFSSTIDNSIFTILRKGAVLAVELAETKPSVPSSRNGKLSHHSSTKHEPNAFLLESELEQVLLRDSYEKIPSDIFLLAKECVKLAQLTIPSRIIGLDVSCRAILASIARDQNTNPSTYQFDLPLLRQLFHWALKGSRSQAISHLLVNKTSGLKLVPSNEAYVRTRLPSSDTLTSTMDDSLPCVSDVYLDGVSPPTEQFLQTYRIFLEKCGCQTGLSLIACTRSMTLVDKSYLPESGSLPKLRQSNPSVPLYLPFHLGPLTRKKVEIVDIALSPEWLTILTNASKNLSLAENVTEMICVMLSSIDTATVITPETTPYLLHLLQGRTDDSMNNSIDSHTLASHRIPSNLEKFPPPAFSRMFFLPPARPGAEVINLGPAEWISQLARLRWVPSLPPGSELHDPPSLILAPCEVLLSKDQNHTLSDLMPQAKLHHKQIQILQNLPPLLSTLFAWGTVAPPPPLEQFERLCQTPTDVPNDENPFNGVITCSRSKYLEVANIWQSLLHAFHENRLTARERSRILKALNQDRRQLFILPGPLKNTLISISRCVSPSLSSDQDEDVITSLLCQIGYLHDLKTEPSTRDDWILNTYRSQLTGFLSLPKIASSDHLNDYLNRTFSLTSSRHQHLPPTPLQKMAFSYSLWLLAKEQLTLPELQSLFRSQTFSTSIVEKVRNSFQKKFLEFSVYCKRGNGLENSNLPGEWVILWSQTLPPTNVRPILIDDEHHGAKGCGVLRSSLLKKEHQFEPLAILDHCLHRQHSSHLLEVESFLRTVLDLPSISDSKYFSLSARSGGVQESLVEATERFQVIIALLLFLDFQNVQVAKKVPMSLSPILKCSSLSLLFRYPKFEDKKMIGLKDSSSIPVYAIRGAPMPLKSSSILSSTADDHSNTSHLQKVQSLLITGTPHDYVPELEELILLIAYGTQRPVISSNVRKALSLLNHLESGSEFVKYFDRHFQDLLTLSVVKGDEDVDTNYHQQLHEAVKKVKERCSAQSVLEQQKLKLSESSHSAALERTDRTAAIHRQPPICEGKQEDLHLIDQKNLGAAESFLSSISTTPPVVSASLPHLSAPQGRGVCNLPSWMTTSGPLDTPPVVEDVQIKLPKKRPIEEINEDGSSLPPLKVEDSRCDVPPVVNFLQGRGRGVSNLPAWMADQSTLSGQETVSTSKRQCLPTVDDQFDDAPPLTPPPNPPSPDLQNSQQMFRLLMTDLLEIMSQTSQFSLSLPSTRFLLVSTLSSALSDSQQRNLEIAISGPLKQELLVALTILQNNTSPSAHSLREYLLGTMNSKDKD
jgi:hypothetical protein